MHERRKPIKQARVCDLRTGSSVANPARNFKIGRGVVRALAQCRILLARQVEAAEAPSVNRLMGVNTGRAGGLYLSTL